ncbi:MAG: ABC transporter permease [Candidatus Omnitrophica bacterium]|nr:ABC transporter permease [Candidatus Omnitrophota bacterium]MCA9426397.1 ABC transporter permease [Candidatus Omnitrophota bacterium]MCA9434662.1 ABC transporter permease [Candidatus Omnitrophota bacterium]
MKTYVLRRLLQAIPILLLVPFFTFLLIELAPGNVVDAWKLDPQIPDEVIEQVSKKYGLDQPWYMRYLTWMKGAVTELDLGYSVPNKRDVAPIIGERLFNTFILALYATFLEWVIAIPLGILSATKQYTIVDKICSTIAFLGLSIPNVFLALLALLFAYSTGWFPVGGLRSIDYESYSAWGKFLDLMHHLTLPAFVLAAAGLATYMRQMRGNLLDQLRADYLTTARAKGLTEPVVVGKHAVRNAINPLITLFGFSISNLLSGSVLVETVMSYPGLGRTVVEALFTQDEYLVVAALLMGAVLLILGNLLADILLALSDPRIRLQ